jgi:hypothetical protein
MYNKVRNRHLIALHPPSNNAPAQMVQTYSINDLQSIGKACRSQLPPASAVQAMFQYELQRQTEVEHLFHV